MYWKRLTACIAAGMFLSAPSLVAAPHHHTGSARHAKLSALDKTFLKDTAQSNLEEIELKALVLKRAKKFATKDYARYLEQDHARANRSLTALAARKGFTLPQTISTDQKAVLKQLSSKPASLFDAAYKHEMIRDHRGDIAKARREVSLGHDRTLRSLARRQIGMLQMHLGMAYSLPGYTAHRPGTGIGSR